MTLIISYTWDLKVVNRNKFTNDILKSRVDCNDIQHEVQARRSPFERVPESDSNLRCVGTRLNIRIRRPLRKMHACSNVEAAWRRAHTRVRRRSGECVPSTSVSTRVKSYVRYTCVPRVRLMWVTLSVPPTRYVRFLLTRDDRTSNGNKYQWTLFVPVSR